MIVLGSCIAFGVVFGALWGLAATTKLGGLVSGALTGGFLSFGMFGIETAAVRIASDGESSFFIAIKTLPLPLLLVPLFALFQAIRYSWSRVNRHPENLLALVTKIALIVTVATTILASLLSLGDTSEDSFGEGSQFVSKVSSGSAAFYPFLILFAAGVAVLLWRRVPIAGGRVNRVVNSDAARSFGVGALLFLGIAVVLSPVVLIGDIVAADDGKDKLYTLFNFFVSGVNKGVGAAVFAMGGAVARAGSHLSLFHWGAYESPADGNAPAPLFLLLAVAPVAIALLGLKWFERSAPDNEQGVVRTAAAGVGGFVIASWLLSLATALAFTENVESAPSPRSAFGLALVWSCVGFGVAAALWTQRSGLRWSSLQSGSAGGEYDWDEQSWPTFPTARGARAADETYEAHETYETDHVDEPAPAAAEDWSPAPPPPSAAAPLPRAKANCTNCGARLDGAAFCRSCGASAG